MTLQLNSAGVPLPPDPPSIPLLLAFYAAHGNGGSGFYASGGQLFTPAYLTYEELKDQTGPDAAGVGGKYGTPELDAEAAILKQYADDDAAFAKLHGGLTSLGWTPPPATPQPAPPLIAPLNVSVTAPSVVMQQTVASVAATAAAAVNLPASHPAHSWLASFFAAMLPFLRQATPIAAALVAANNPKLAPELGAIAASVHVPSGS